MRKLIILILLIILTSSARAGLLDNMQNLINQSGITHRSVSSSRSQSISYKDKQNALKQALRMGVRYAISRLLKRGGYLNNPLVRVPLPENVKPIARILKKTGQGRLVEKFEISMNRAAEKAAPKTVNIFMRAIKRMTIKDANRILLGGNDAATRYFKEKTYNELFKVIKPIVRQTTESTNVTRYYKQMLSIYKKYSSPLKTISSFKSMLTGKSSNSQPPEDLDTYITQKAIDGIFKMIAHEEEKIRENPAARTTNLLRKVFGSIRR